MKKQQDASGGYVLTVPRFIVCPVALETDTESLVSSLTYRVDLLGDQQTPQWVKALRIVADPRLDAVRYGQLVSPLRTRNGSRHSPGVPEWSTLSDHGTRRRL